MRFSLIRLCFVYSVCTLFRAEPRRHEEQQQNMLNGRLVSESRVGFLPVFIILPGFAI
jgi:hypothetical protein